MVLPATESTNASLTPSNPPKPSPITWTAVPGGPDAGVGWSPGCSGTRQVLPVHVHVSPMYSLPNSPDPPKRSTLPRSSLVMARRPRGTGAAAGIAWVQVDPSQTQVSPRLAGPRPPNITTPREAAEYAMPMPQRAGGDVAGDPCVQVLPSQVQVSARDPSLYPPNRTTVLRTGS